MSSKTASGLVKFVKSKLGNPYLYGFKQNSKFDKICTDKDFKKLQKLYPEPLVMKSDYKKCVGKTPCDCSGLISAYTGIQKGSYQFKETATRIEPISKLPLAVKGCLLWQKGHIGVYIGNGEYIAEDGSRYGCRKNKVSNSSFTHILWCSDISYTTKITTKKPHFKKCSNRCTSIVDGLNEINSKSDLTYRKKIANVNNIENYIGSAKQNTAMLNLLKEGKLIKP